MSVNLTTLAEKLSKLNSTQQSIETLSQWCIFYKKDAEQIVTLWEQEFNRSKNVEKMLALIYLANDILQNSRRKGPQFVNAFFQKLPPAVYKLSKSGGSDVRNKMLKMIKVWDERRVFGSSGVKAFTDILGQSPKALPSTAGRKRGNIVLQTNDPTVNSLSSSMQDADEAHSRCQSLLSQTSAVLRKEESQNGADTLKASIKSLQLQTTALENELGHRDRVIGILNDLLSQQKQMKDSAESQWQNFRSNLRERQQKVSVAQSSSQGEEYTVEEPVQNIFASSSPPPPPMDSPNSPPNRNDPRLSQLDSQPSQSEQNPLEFQAQPDPGPHSNSGMPSNGLADSGVMSQLLGGLKDESEDQAANLVAQLSQSGMSAQMLIEALASLPKGAAPPESQIVAAQLPSVEDDEEYDPELGE